MTAILGISAFFHDSAAALVVDGRIAAAAQQERFSRIKHDEGFPRDAIAYCLASAGLSVDDLDYIAFYEKPLLRFDRLLETYLAYAPFGYRSFRHTLPMWLRDKLHMRRTFDDELGRRFRGRYVFTDHHESHAASAFLPSPFDEAAILTIDGVGEWTTTCVGHGRGNRIELLDEIRFPHSLGLLYSAFTYYLGFRVNSGEYKVMGLAPYGRPLFRDAILDNLADVKEDGSFRLDMQFFNYCQGMVMTSARFDRLFGGPPRLPESEITSRHMDLAASVQAVAEEIVLRCARTAVERSGCGNLVMAGGVALNCVANGRLLHEKVVDRLWIQPAAGDAGGSLGAALFTWHQLLGNPREPASCDSQQGSLLGPEFCDDEIVRCLVDAGVEYETLAGDDALCEEVCDLLEQEKVVGWFQGRMEFGPRALGARSILADPRSRRMQSQLNQQIKFRESFRPFAPAVLAERVHEWFDVPTGFESPYMLVTAQVHATRRLPHDGAELQGFARLHEARSTIPAVTHVDNSARIQTVDASRNPLFHRLLSVFYERTGCPVLVNTSFNVRGEPLVCTPDEALRCLLATEMDALAIGRNIVYAHRHSAMTADERSRHLAHFPLD